MTNAELITELTYHASIEKRKLLSDAANALEAADRLLDQNTQRCEALRKQLRESHESYEKHINELEAKIPKEGKWIKHGCEEDQFAYCECPFCGFIGLEYHYCPNCGARMKTVTDCHTLGEEER